MPTSFGKFFFCFFFVNFASKLYIRSNATAAHNLTLAENVTYQMDTNLPPKRMRLPVFDGFSVLTRKDHANDQFANVIRRLLMTWPMRKLNGIFCIMHDGDSSMPTSTANDINQVVETVLCDRRN